MGAQAGDRRREDGDVANGRREVGFASARSLLLTVLGEFVLPFP